MNRPLLLDFEVPRIGEKDVPYSYDNVLDINVVEKEGSKIPYISYGSNQAELLTKTEVDREQDEDVINCLELQTKTNAQREHDDEVMNCLELSTKTAVPREQDDESFNLLELYTKTRAERERDDE